MSQISTNEFKQGLKIVLDKSPCEIIEHEFHKPGKGQAVMRIKYRDLLSNRVLEKTFKTGESVEKAEISSKEMQFFINKIIKLFLWTQRITNNLNAINQKLKNRLFG